MVSILTNKYKKYTGTKSYVTYKNYQYWNIALDEVISFDGYGVQGNVHINPELLEEHE